jgi:hypothetical protein
MATDDCGNSTSDSFTITVQDTEAPTFVEALPADETVECDAVPAAAVLSAMDNCDIGLGVLFEEVTTAGACANGYTLTRTWSAVDCSGNATSHSQVITVEDTTAPAIAAESEVYVACGDFPGAAQASATDNCGEVTLTFADLPFAGGCVQPIGQYVRTYTAVDACGNTSTFEQIVTLTDAIAPEVLIACPADASVNLGDGCIADVSPALTGEATASATDNCGTAPEVTLTYTDGEATAACGASYTFVRTWTATATDACGNSAFVTCEQLISVQDAEAPVIEAEPFVQVPCAEFNDDEAYATVSDGCSGAELTFSTLPFAGGCVTPYMNFTRIYTAIDGCGNVAEFEQVIMLVDDVDPVFTFVPADVTVECDQPIPSEEAAAIDNCDAAVVITSSDVIIPGISANDYTIERTFTATDHCGNTATAVQTISVEDTTPPVIVSYEPVITVTPADLASMGGIAALLQMYQPYCIDNCDEGVSTPGPVGPGNPGPGAIPCTVTYDSIPGICPGTFTLEVLFVHSDASGNSTEVVVTVNVVDSEAPAFVEELPADATVECDAVPAAAVLTATDNFGEVEVLFTEELVEGACANNFTLIRTWTVGDCSGNGLSHTQTLTVEDTTAPSFTFVPEDYTAECSDELTLEIAVAEDSCGDVAMMVNETSEAGECANEHILTRTFTATDACGNESTATQTITVVDTTAPVFTFVPADVQVECDAPIPMMDLATATDNCGEVTVTYADVEVTNISDQDYDIIRTFTATDACGNVSTATQTIFVRDTQAPAVVAYVPTVTMTYQELLNFGSLQALVNYYQPLCVDNCDPTVGGGGPGTGASNPFSGIPCTMTYDSIPGDCFGNFTIEALFTHNDASGNHLELIVIISIVDTIAPVIDSVPADLTLECDALVPTEFVSATDDVSPADLLVYGFTDEVIAGTCPNAYTLVRTHTATDDCGNVATAVQTIHVEDTTAPSFTFVPADATVECDEVLSLEDATAVDNCGDVVVTVEETTAAGDCANAYTLTRTFTATDACGNEASATQVITVVDTTAPVFTFVPADVQVECDAPIPTDLATATDNCDGAVGITSSDVIIPGISPQDYDIIRTFTATDACGNTSTASQTIYVRDTQAPTVVAYVPTVTMTYQDLLNFGSLQNLVNFYQPLCIDNCDPTVGGGGLGVGDGAPDSIPPFSGIPCTMTYDSIPGDCYGNFTIEALFTHADASGNHLELVVVINIVDEVAPVFASVPADLSLSCIDELPTELASATDDVSPADLIAYGYTDEVIAGDCASEYTIIRTHTAADDCGNTATAIQTITVEDTGAPSFIGDLPEDITIECGDEVSVAALQAEDACGADITIDVVDTSVEGTCAGEEVITRVWTATDCAGNSATYTQTITVIDATGPEVVASCTYENGQIIELCFDDPQGNFDLPAPCNVTFADACGGPVTVTYEETILGDGIATAPGVLNYCEPSNPAPLASGSCSNTAPHALRLINFPGGQFYLAQEGTVTQLADGRWILTQTVVHASNPNAGWNISMTYGPGMNWTQWLAQPGPQGYKFDCPILVDDHLNWTYRLLQSGTLTGWGSFAGSQFNLFHQPANGYFGMQLGHGASNLNNNFGYVGWFFMVGQHQGVSYSGTGDIFGDLNCAQPVSVERVYTATDCAGNESQFSYTLLYNTVNCDNSPVAPGTGNATGGSNGLAPSDGDAHAAGQGTFRSAEVLPNPTQDATALRLVLDEEERVRVDVVSLTGATLLGEVFEGTLAEGMQHSIPLNVSGLAAGMYQVRVQSATRQSVVRLLIVD